ncbi:uncharacterized protein cd79b [Cololabis saira]|uniref:uncharacterized protein cd79b n=1 Tax=Cololabis saira TaxID=129043 RepID=UPI002AD4C48E|nr:uncharacterized protein cd79b [Cololabis saira]
MRWILAGCFGVALVTLSVALQVNQKPRFYGITSDHKQIIIYCLTNKDPNSKVSWLKLDEYNAAKNNGQEIQKSDRIHLVNSHNVSGSVLYIFHPQIEDSGVYFCKIKDEWGPGTDVRVYRRSTIPHAEYRSKMKDGLIVLQGLLIALCIAAVLLRQQTLAEKKDSEYEDPDTDHIYEGLAIETCAGGLYEDLTAYTHADGAEAPWE